MELINKKITSVEAASFLGISIRQLRRIRRRYEKDGAKGLIHRARGMPSSRRMSDSQEAQILFLLHSRYRDFGPTFAAEKLKEEHNITVSREKLRKLQIREKLWKPKSKKKSVYHPRRTRRSQLGALVQIDGSHHDWFEGRAPKCCLLAFIDDATSKVVAAAFFSGETTEAYKSLTKQYVLEYGRPLAMYSDKHNIFRSPKKDNRNKGVLSCFGQSLKMLKVELICAHSPQAKGRIERCFGTLQDRLVKELRLAKISDIQEANKFLVEYIPKHNRRFSKPATNLENAHRELPSELDLEIVFSTFEERTLGRDLSFQYKNKIYQAVNVKTPRRLQKKKIQVIETLSGKMIVKDADGNTIETKLYSEFSGPVQQTLDSKAIECQWVETTKYKPKMNHPWR